jgi:hypothetical protein
MSYRKMLVILPLGALPLALQARTVNWNPPSTASPVPMCCVDMAYDDLRDVTVLFGGAEGINSSTPFASHGETWTLNAGGCIQVQPADPTNTVAPSPRAGVAIAYDPTNRVTVLFGGSTSGFDQARYIGSARTG